MLTYNDIAEHVAAEKTPAQIAAILQVTVRDTPRRLCYAVESGTAIAETGDNRRAVMQAMLSDPDGQMLYQKLSSSSGVEWAHPATVPFLDSLVSAGVLSTAGRDALITLSAPGYYRTANATVEDVQACIDDENARLARAAFDATWTTEQNETINPAAATGNVATLVAALRTAADNLEAA